MSSFDPQIAGFIKGEFVSIACIDPATEFPGSQPNHVLDPSQSFNITMEWKLSGPGATLWLSNAIGVGENWSVDVFAESMGPGPEMRIGSTTVSVTDPSIHTFITSVPVAAYTLPEGNPGPSGPSGLYKLVCSCFLNSNLVGSSGEGYDISGYMEGPVIRIENPA